jgi:hypothetical protein
VHASIQQSELMKLLLCTVPAWFDRSIVVHVCGCAPFVEEYGCLKNQAVCASTTVLLLLLSYFRRVV